MYITMQTNSVELQTSHIRITRDFSVDDPPFTPQNFVLWVKDGTINGKTNPATIPLVGAILTVNIASTNDEPFDFTLSATIKGRQIGMSQRMTYAARAASVDVTVPITSSMAPWGSSGMIRWTYNIFLGSENWTQIADTPVQLYAVASDMAPMYMNGGIPQEMLDLFVDKYTDTGSSSIEEWVTWAVTRCHASGKDPKIQAAKLEAIHNYTYSNYAGEPMFTKGQTFDLPRWLKSRLTASVLSTVNCYDQTAIVICALSLGLPYYLRSQDGQIVTEKSNKVTTLQRFAKGAWDNASWKRFGYINITDLVGWGDCNNPFFGSEKTEKIVNSTDYKARSSFKNHLFVCYNIVDSQGVKVQSALDACAGPVAAPVPLDTYLTDVIDPTPSLARNGAGWELLGNVETIAPTDTIKVLSLFQSSLKTDVDPESLTWKALNQAQGSRPVPTNPINASLTGLFGSIPNVKTSTPDTYIDKDRSCISVEFSRSGDPQRTPFAAATFDVMKDFQSAKLQARSRIASLDRDLSSVFATPTEAQYLGDINLVAKPDIGIVLLVYGNVSIWLDGSLAPQADFDALVKSIDTYMTAEKNNVLTPQPDTAFTVSDVKDVTIGVPFQVTITAPGVEVVEVDLKSDFVHITKGPYQQKNDPGIWTIDCITFEAKPDQLAIGFAEGDTYFPNTNKVISITPNLLVDDDGGR